MYLLILLILIQLPLFLVLLLPALVVVILDAVETRRKTIPALDVFEVIGVVLVDGGLLAGA